MRWALETLRKDRAEFRYLLPRNRRMFITYSQAFPRGAARLAFATLDEAVLRRFNPVQTGKILIHSANLRVASITGPAWCPLDP